MLFTRKALDSLHGPAFSFFSLYFLTYLDYVDDNVVEWIFRRWWLLTTHRTGSVNSTGIRIHRLLSFSFLICKTGAAVIFKLRELNRCLL